MNTRQTTPDQTVVTAVTTNDTSEHKDHDDDASIDEYRRVVLKCITEYLTLVRAHSGSSQRP
jgi:hypothetical protein